MATVFAGEAMAQEQLPQEQPLRWGILGAGRVCHDFVQALKFVPQAAKVVAVGCRDKSRSEIFGDTHSLSDAKFYGSYAEAARDPSVEIVYVGMLHPWHMEVAMEAINAGKHVLVEKPATCSLSDTLELLAHAKAKGVFLMEGIWTRFFPAVRHARRVIEEGLIGTVVGVNSDFGFNASDVAPEADHIMYQKKLGGGGLWYVSPYPISAAVASFGSEPPTNFGAVGVVDPARHVDMAASMSIQYEGKGLATLCYSMLGETPEETWIIGTKGRIRLLNPSHCPTRVEITAKYEGRGNVETQIHEYPLRPEPQEVTMSGGFYYPNSQGFKYEAEAVHRAIRSGLRECPDYTHAEMEAVARIMDALRQQLGL